MLFNSLEFLIFGTLFFALWPLMKRGDLRRWCFITAASCELDGRPGELRSLLLATVTQWRTFLREQIVIARTAGDITTTLDADDLVTALTGIAMSANQEIQLLADATAPARARRLMLAAITR